MGGAYRTVYAFAREMHPRLPNLPDVPYGTAGFRTKAMYLDHIAYRMGLLAVLRSRTQDGAVIGLMITASHNLEPDNGVKLIDPFGEMLDIKWEPLATKLANVEDTELPSVVDEIVKLHNIDMRLKASVYIGIDTRYTSPGLAKAACNGVMAMQGTPTEFGIVTTPMLHYYVRCKNTNNQYGIPTDEGYYNKLVNAFKKLRGPNPINSSYNPSLYLDGANGVGGKKMNVIKKKLDGFLDVTIFNAGGNGGKLNLNCGADFVKVQQTAPVGVPKELNQRVASFDGDADRLIYYYLDNSETFHLLDGDRIATLLGGYLMSLIKKCQLSDLKMGIVQTAYANGASTEYITDKLCVPVACVSTGVKHLHHEAMKYDIGIYFEANGHGTVTYSKRAKASIKAASADQGLNPDQRDAATRMLALIDLTNETVGDAISDMFLVETVLHHNGWDVHQWFQAYEDLPCKQLKVSVKDRNLITTKHAERICVTPEGLQNRIDALCAKYPKGRSFVRASGTEDVVRVYAETASKEDTEHLATEVASAIYEMAHGVGDPPLLSKY